MSCDYLPEKLRHHEYPTGSSWPLPRRLTSPDPSRPPLPTTVEVSPPLTPHSPLDSHPRLTVVLAPSPPDLSPPFFLSCLSRPPRDPLRSLGYNRGSRFPKVLYDGVPGPTSCPGLPSSPKGAKTLPSSTWYVYCPGRNPPPPPPTRLLSRSQPPTTGTGGSPGRYFPTRYLCGKLYEESCPRVLGGTGRVRTSPFGRGGRWNGEEYVLLVG